MNFHEILKKLTHRASSTTSSPSQSKTTSRASSLHESPAVHAKYLNDPMRTSSHPDSVGYYVDPMGGRSSYYASYDVTNTGA
ncbi:hypothetical protein BC941DRAFT_434278 [Chlamydoabsidia padenii]|nr:hypothetical protein BC941DRAFT_434278 [Chlamydoabsidia padenii]